MNIIKSELTIFTQIMTLINDKTEELVAREIYDFNSRRLADKKFIEFWEKCLLEFHKKNDYKIKQTIINNRAYTGDVIFLDDSDEVTNFQGDEYTLFFRRSVNLHNILYYESLCDIHHISISKDILEIKKIIN